MAREFDRKVEIGSLVFLSFPGDDLIHRTISTSSYSHSFSAAAPLGETRNRAIRLGIGAGDNYSTASGVFLCGNAIIPPQFLSLVFQQLFHLNTTSGQVYILIN